VRARSYVVVGLIGAAIAWWWLQSPTPPRRDPIAVGNGMVVVENQSDRAWSNVVITVNDHFFGGARTLAAGARLNAPLSQFQTGHGQYFDRGRMSVTKVLVTASDGGAQPVRLEWAAPRRGDTP
jgi:hypothetical protein